MTLTKTKTIKCIIALLIGILCIFVVTPFAKSPTNPVNAATIEKLDEKRNTVLALTAAATSSSAALSLLPNDTATPIAEKLADLSGYFLIALSALLLEKYLLVVAGWGAFNLIIPAACLFYCIYVIFDKQSCLKMVKKLCVFSIVFLMVVPSSVYVSNLIENTFDASIQETIDYANQTTEEIEEKKEDSNALKKFWENVTEGFSSAINGVEQMLNRFIEAVAVMLVTSCLIPILVLLLFVWIMKILLDIDFSSKD